jgi:uncharacterized protein YbaP (TraB family)
MPTSLWRDTTSGLSLLGSIHHLPKSAYPLPSQVESAYLDASILVVEARNTDVWAPPLRFLRAGTLLDVLGRDLHDQLKEAAEKIGISLEGTDHYQPFYVASHLYEEAMNRLLDSKQVDGIDSHLINRADIDGKKVEPLEDINYVPFIMRANLEAGREYLRQALDEIDALENQQLVFREAWRTGSIATLEALTNDDAYPLVKKALITERNHQWLSRLMEIRASGERVLVVVGVGHLLGAGNLRELLEAHGAEFSQL